MKDFTLTHLCEASHKWVFGNRISPGMAVEIKKARRWNIPVRYFTTQCEETGGVK